MSETTAPDPAPGGSAVVLHLGEGRQLPRWFWRAIVAVTVSVAAYQVGRSIIDKLTGLLVIIAISLFLSFAIEPAVNYLADRGWRRGRATLLCFVALFVAAGVFVFVMGELVVGQVADLAEKAPGYVNDASDWLNDTFDTDITTREINQRIEDYQDDITKVATNVGGKVLSITGAVIGTIFQAFTVGLFAFYMTSQGPQLRRNVCSTLPRQRQETVLLLWELAIQKTGGWIYSRLLLAGVAAASMWIFLTILGVPSPLALALWVGLVSQFIPAIGTYLAGALPVLIALLNDPLDAVWVLGFIVVYQQIENYFLSPKITAHTMDLHPAVAFGAALAGASLLGPMGAIMALPFAGVVQAFVSTFMERHEVVDSHLTELEVIRAEQGDSALRRAMRSILRGGTASGEVEEEPGEGDGPAGEPEDAPGGDGPPSGSPDP